MPASAAMHAPSFRFLPLLTMVSLVGLTACADDTSGDAMTSTSSTSGGSSGDESDTNNTSGVSESSSSTTTASTTTASTTTASTTSASTTTDGTTGDTAGSTGGDTDGTGGSTGGAAAMSGTCDEPFTITQGETAMGDTTGEADDLTAVSASGFGSCQTGGAGEHVYAFTPTAGGTVTATLSSVADLGLFVRHGCDDGATEFSCVDDVGGGTDEELTLTVVANATYYLVVDGYGAGEEGAYTLTIGDVTGEADCTDGVDDNGNVLVDCEDPSCLTDASCVTAIGATCGAASGLMPGMDQAGDTSMGSPDFATVAPTCTGAGGALVEAYEYTPGADSLLRLELSSATDQGFFVRSQCDGPQSQVACTDFQYGGDNEIDYVPVSSGTTYSVFVSAYQAAEEGPYSLRSDVFGLDETEPNEDTASANAAGMSQLGYIGTQNDQDWYEITIAQASDVVVETADVAMGDCEAGQIDTDLELFQSDGTTSVAFNDDIDDTNDNYCSRVEGQALAAGTYYVRVRSSEAYCAACTVPYRLTVDIAE